MAQLLKPRLTSKNIALVTLVTLIMKDYRTVSVLVNPTGRVNTEIDQDCCAVRKI